MKVLKVFGTEGYAEGRAFVVRRKNEQDTPSPVKGGGLSVSTEKERISRALSSVKSDLEALSRNMDGDMAGVFAAHLEMASDPLIEENVAAALDSGLSAENAVRQAQNEICALFTDVDDEYLRSRVDDVKDVCDRIIRKLSGADDNPFAAVQDGTIVVAESLSPSDTALMDFTKIRAIVTEKGSATSHVCIIARSKGIPAVVGAEGCLDDIKQGDMLLVDGETHTVTVAPDDEQIKEFRETASLFASRVKAANDAAHSPAVSASGERCYVYGNAGSLVDIEKCLLSGADGIGLLRSEFLYMQSKELPSEDVQFDAYRKAAVLCGESPLIIRTLDIGGDKSLPYMALPLEDNPFLGLRAIRLCLSRQDMFKAQIRAILRSGAENYLPGVGRSVRMLIPMVSTLEEFTETKALVHQCAEELHNEGVPCDSDMKIGVMIETPSAAIISDRLAEEADFFSVGTNDLTQYIMAADRGNTSVGHLYDIRNEAVMRMMRLVARNASAAGIEAEICGEAAADLSLTETFLQMGYTSFSVSAPSVAPLKDKLRNCRVR